VKDVHTSFSLGEVKAGRCAAVGALAGRRARESTGS
jgi:hypothetical protein